MIGVFGGTFDPPHLGHVFIVQSLLQLFPFKEIRVVPAGCPPHRPVPTASAQDRCEMARLAFCSIPKVWVDDWETRQQGPSYTVDTLTYFATSPVPPFEKGGLGGIFLILGIDAFLGLPSWHLPHEVFNLAQVIVIPRAGISLSEAKRQINQVMKALGADAKRLTYASAITPPGISSTLIRQNISQRRGVQALLPKAVWKFIKQKRLYGFEGLEK